MVVAQILGLVEIGDRAGHAQDPVIAPRRQTEAIRDLAQKRAAFGIEGGDVFKHGPFCFGIHPDLGVIGEALALHIPRPCDPFRDGGRSLARRRKVKVGIGDGRNLHTQIEAVHQRARDTAHIILGTDWRPAASAVCIGQMAAFAGVGGRNE